MTYTFNWEGITYTIDETLRTISFQAPNESIKTVYKVSTMISNSDRKNITVTDILRYKVDPASNATIDGTIFKLAERNYNNNTLNSQGQGYWDFFYGLTGQFGPVIEKALINNQLENMQSIFGQGEQPTIFNPYNSWTFFYPIHLTLSTTLETAENASDGKVIATVNNPVAGHNYEYSIDNGTTWAGTGNSHTFINLTAGTYTVQVRSTVDNVPKQKSVELATEASV